MSEATSSPCDACPWRLKNQGKKTPWGFYTKANLTRLWNELRSGGTPQSCHPTDPSHPDHCAAGAKPGAKPKECAGSVILVLREMQLMAEPDGTIAEEGLARYRRERRARGLKYPNGIRYWLLDRYQFGGVPLVGGSKLPIVDVGDPEVGLPPELKDG